MASDPKVLTEQEIEAIVGRFYAERTPGYWASINDYDKVRMVFALVDKIDDAQRILNALGYEIRKA